MSNTLRLFVAINFNPKIQRSIKHIQDHLGKTDCDVKWVKPKNIHITLKFLGNIEIQKIDVVKQALINHYQNTRSFKIELTQLGTFPNINHPRILWIGLKDSKQRLNQIVTLLQKALVKIGFEEDKKSFSPHITIGRMRSLKNINLLSESISTYQAPKNLTQVITTIILYKSTLTSQGPIYESLYQITLK